MDVHGAHIYGVRLDGVRHVCPSCGITAVTTLCRWCGGLGTVTEEDLRRYATWWNDHVSRGERPE